MHFVSKCLIVHIPHPLRSAYGLAFLVHRANSDLLNWFITYSVMSESQQSFINMFIIKYIWGQVFVHKMIFLLLVEFKHVLWETRENISGILNSSTHYVRNKLRQDVLRSKFAIYQAFYKLYLLHSHEKQTANNFLPPSSIIKVKESVPFLCRYDWGVC